MSGRLMQLLSAGWLLLWLSGDCYGKRRWDYEPLSLVFNSSNPDILMSDPQTVRVDRGEYAISGTLWYGGDVDDACRVEALSYRSETGGEDDYKRLPWNIPNQKLKEFLTGFYKEVVYQNIKDCSNVPAPEKAYPWPKGEVVFDKCMPEGEGLPEHLPPGYYKLIFNVSGCVDAVLVAIVKLTTASDIFR